MRCQGEVPDSIGPSHLGLHRPICHLLSAPALPKTQDVEEYTLKSALKAQTLPEDGCSWHTIWSTLPPSKGEKPAEPWILLEAELPLTHSALKPSTPYQASEGIPAVILFLVNLCTGWCCHSVPTSWGEFEAFAPSPPQTKSPGTLPWGHGDKNMSGKNLGS